MSEAAEYGSRLRTLADQLHEIADAIDPDGSEKVDAVVARRGHVLTFSWDELSPGGGGKLTAHRAVLNTYLTLGDTHEVRLAGTPVQVTVSPA